MKKNKKVLVGIVSVAFILCVALIIAFTTKSSQPDVTTTSTTQKETVKISNVAPTLELENAEIDSTTSVTTTTNSTTSKTTVKKTETTSKAKNTTSTKGEKATTSPLISKRQYWYYYDEHEKSCYVFNFISDKRVKVDYLSPEIIKETSNNYERDFCHYRVDGNKIKFEAGLTKLPDSHFYLEIKNNELYYGKIKLENHKDISVMEVARHFR